jgi:hypothetical protein
MTKAAVEMTVLVSVYMLAEVTGDDCFSHLLNDPICRQRFWHK